MIYRLGSNPMVHAPGIIAWATAHYWNEPDRPALEKIIGETWKVPSPVVKALLSKQITPTIEGETVVIDASSLTHGDA